MSPPLASLARENAEATGLVVEFLEGDLFEALPGSIQGRVDLLVSNPPYVATAEMDLLPAEIREHEPVGALDAGSTGLESLEQIALGARRWLRPGGTIACEIGETQGEACLRAFSGYSPQIERDLAGKPRYVLGRAPESANVH